MTQWRFSQAALLVSNVCMKKQKAGLNKFRQQGKCY